jgi:hypothetical protein
LLLLDRIAQRLTGRRIRRTPNGALRQRARWQDEPD